jgi:hypothetical protein
MQGGGVPCVPSAEAFLCFIRSANFEETPENFSETDFPIDVEGVFPESIKDPTLWVCALIGRAPNNSATNVAKANILEFFILLFSYPAFDA